MTRTDATRRRIAVLGGGIAGLTAAYSLAQARQSGAQIEEFLIESRSCLGGVIHTETTNGFVVEAGPDSFLTEKPAAAALCHELGLGDSLMGSNDSDRQTYILHRGKLVPLPDGLMLLVPTRTWSIAKTPLLPLRSKLAIASEWFMSPPDHQIDDESVAEFVRRHYGSAMLENIAEPLLSGVYGGDSASLSARSVLNRFWQMEKQYGSVTRGTLKARRQRKLEATQDPLAMPSTLPPLFTTLKNGLGQMIEALSNKLESSRIFMGQNVLKVKAEALNSESFYRIQCDEDVSYIADAIIFAVPAFECSRLLAGLDPKLADSLGRITYNSAMTVALGYDADTATRLPPGFGFLVPKKENRRLLACTFVHAKFSHRAPAGRALLRCFLGGPRDPDILNLSDQAIVALVRQELDAILKFSADPLFSRVHRIPRSMAQYLVGHEEIVSRINDRLDQHPGIALAGNAYSGIGISDCIRTGRAAAERVMKNVCK